MQTDSDEPESDGTRVYVAPLHMFQYASRARQGDRVAALSMIGTLRNDFRDGRPISVVVAEYFVEAFTAILDGVPSKKALGLAGVDKGRKKAKDEKLYLAVETARSSGKRIGSGKAADGEEADVYAFVAKTHHVSVGTVRQAHEKVRARENAFSAFGKGEASSAQSQRVIDEIVGLVRPSPKK